MKCEVVLRENPNRVFRPGELMEGSIVIKCRNESVINGERKKKLDTKLRNSQY